MTNRESIKEENWLEQFPEQIIPSQDRVLRVSLYQKLLSNLTINIPKLEQQAAVPLRVSQWNAIHNFVDFLRQEGGGGRSGHFLLPTGAGKTFLFGAIIKLLGVRTLVLEPRSNLVDQTYREFTTQIGISPETVGTLAENEQQLNRQILIGTYQGHRIRMERDPYYRNLMQLCELIICDEAHRALGPATQASIHAVELGFDSEETPNEQIATEDDLCALTNQTSHRALNLAFSATSQLMHKAVHEYFGPLIARETHSDLVNAGILAKYRIVQVQGHVQPGEIASTISERQEASLLKREQVYEKAIKRLLQLQKEVPEKLLPIAFLSSVRECDVFASKALKKSMKCEIVTNREAQRSGQNDLIREAQERLLRGETDILVSVEKLQLGWNFPPLNTVLQLRATTSPSVLIQQAGRASRRTQGKKFAYIIEPRWRPDVGVEGTGGGGGGNGGSGTSKASTSVSLPQKFYATPLTLAEALNIVGEENIDAACMRHDGRKLSYDIVKPLGEDGTVDLGGDSCAFLEVFSKFHNYPDNLLEREVNRANLQPLGLALFQKHYVPVYRVRDVLALQGIQEYEMQRKFTAAYGIVIDGEKRMTAARFAVFHGLPQPNVLRAIEKTNMTPMKYVVAEEEFLLYRLIDLEALPYIQQHSTLQKIPIGLSEVVIRGVKGIVPRAFAQQHGIDPELLESACRKNLLSIGYAISGIGDPQPVFSKIEVETIPFVRNWLRISVLPEIEGNTALVKLRGGGVGISLTQFVLLNPTIDYQKLLNAVQKAKLQPIGLGRYNFSKSVGMNHDKKEVNPTENLRFGEEPIYSKDQIQNLPYIQRCLHQK